MHILHRTIICTLFVFSVLTSHAQYDEEFGFYLGTSIPLGEFAAKDLANGSYATLGFNASIDYTRFFYKNWGVFVVLSYQFNPYDDKAIKNDFSTLLENTPDTDVESISVSSGKFHSAFAMFGLAYAIRISKNWKFTLKGGGGFFGGRTNDKTISITTLVPPNATPFTRTFDFGVQSYDSFTYVAGGSFGHKINQRNSINLSLWFTSANPTYFITLPDGSKSDGRQRYSILTLSVGWVILK